MEDEDNMQSREKAPRLIRRCILVIAGLTLSALPTVAQVRSNGFFLTSPLEISSGYDSRFITSTGQLSGPVSTVTGPVMSWINSTHRTHFSIDYKPEAQFLPGNPDLNSWNQSSILRLTNRLNSRWSLDLGNSFLDTSDPNRAASHEVRYGGLPDSTREIAVLGGFQCNPGLITALAVLHGK